MSTFFIAAMADYVNQTDVRRPARARQPAKRPSNYVNFRFPVFYSAKSLVQADPRDPESRTRRGSPQPNRCTCSARNISLHNNLQNNKNFLKKVLTL